MTTMEQDTLAAHELEMREAGVSDLMELYERIEATYVRAATATIPFQITQTSDSTNPEAISNAYLGRDSNRTE